MREFVQAWTDAFREHRLLTYATAIALRALICFVSLTFLALALLGAVGQRDVWQRHIAPAIEPKVTHPTFVAINAAAEKVFASNSAGLIVFALLYALWQMSGSLRAVMDALNAIVDCDEKRPTLYRYGLSVALAAVAIALIACALFVVAGADRLLGASGGVSHWLIAVLRWPAAAIFLGFAVGIVARFAPVEHRGARWASVGATLIVVACLVGVRRAGGSSGWRRAGIGSGFQPPPRSEWSAPTPCRSCRTRSAKRRTAFLPTANRKGHPKPRSRGRRNCCS